MDGVDDTLPHPILVFLISELQLLPSLDTGEPRTVMRTKQRSIGCCSAILE